MFIESVFYRNLGFNLFIHSGRIFVITSDYFVRKNVFKDVNSRFIDNGNLFIHIKIRKTFFTVK